MTRQIRMSLLSLFLLTTLFVTTPIKAQGHVIFINYDHGVFFANGNFFYYTCEKADEILRSKDLKRYPNFEGLIPFSLGRFMQHRENTSFVQCLKLRHAAAERIGKYGTANQMMIKSWGAARVAQLQPID